MRKLFLFINFICFQFISAQTASYTFQVNQSCTSCCAATACATFTYNCTGPAMQFALVTPTTTSPLYTINPCFNNLCNGSYTFIIAGITNTDLCITCSIVVSNPPQTTDFNENMLSLLNGRAYPNPSSHEFKFEISNLSFDSYGYTLYLEDYKGQIIREFEANPDSVYSTRGIDTGLYFVILRKNGKVYWKQKLIIG